MKITIIADNYVDTACLVAEHGFSCLIETVNKKILFDTGQGSVLINNIRALNIFEDIDMIVLSHGHYDHTGGLSAHLDELSGYCYDIFASEFIFDKHLKKSGDSFDNIGFKSDRSSVEQKFKLHLNSDLKQISENIFLSGSIIRTEKFNADSLLYAKVDGEYVKDIFRDEQYMVVKEEEGIHVITGCTHCGVVNLLNDVKSKFIGYKILSLTGGLHMFRSAHSQIEHVVSFMESEQIKVINTGHCTGLEASMLMKQKLGDRVNITKSGAVYEL
mgnify:CR=1 FL=1